MHLSFVATTLLFSCILANPAFGQTIQINAGSNTDYTDRSGKVWMKDDYFFPTTAPKFTAQNTKKIRKARGKNALFRSERFSLGNLTYVIPVPENGDYEVTLYWSETFFAGRRGENKRLFHVVIDNIMAMPNVDIYKEAGGGYRAMKKVARTTVSGRSIRIDIVRVKQNPKINAIRVEKVRNRSNAPIHPSIQAVIDVPGLPPGQKITGTGRFWADSYSVGDECFCMSTFDHNIGITQVRTPVGWMTAKEACDLIGPGPGWTPSSGYPIYNDIQCGNGPPNDAGDEHLCPGRVDLGGNAGCGHIGPTWKFQ